MLRTTLISRWAILLFAYLLFTLLSALALRHSMNSGMIRFREQISRFVGELLSGETPEEIRTRVTALLAARDRTGSAIGVKFWVVDGKGTIVAASSGEPLPVESEATNPFGTQVHRVRLHSRAEFHAVVETLPENSQFNRLGKIAGGFFLWVLFGTALLGSVAWAAIARQKETVEALATRLQKSESARRNLLQEVGHDLRTPLATLQIVLDRLIDYHDQMKPEQRKVDLHNAVQDLDYLKRLVGFLFTLSDANEPSYRVDFSPLNLADLVTEAIRSRPAVPAFRLAPGSLTDAPLDGDRNLLGRMLRNAFDNAGKFARTQVEINLAAEASGFVLTIVDDGPGPSAASVDSFGKRPADPDFGQAFDLSQSVGVGSAIIRAVAELHGGDASLAACDRGGRLTISLRCRVPMASAA